MILTILKLYANTFLKKYQLSLVGLLILMSLTSCRDNQSQQAKNPATPLSHAFEPAALLPQAAIWHPAGDNALLYQPYDAEIESIRYFWMEGIPRQWDAFQISASDGSAHLVWLNTDGKLWYSQINPDGTQKLLAINLGPSDLHTMIAARLPDGGLTVLWQDDSSTLGIIYVDALGRKLAEQTLDTDATHFDLDTDRTGKIFLTWASVRQVSQYHLSVLAFTANDIGSIDIGQASALDLAIPSSDWLDTLRILVDDEWVYLIRGINSAVNPEVTHFEFRSFSKDDTRPNVLPDSSALPLTLSTNGEPVALRWTGRVHNWDTPSAQLTMTAYLDQQWTAILLNFANGTLDDYEILSNLPADASQPRVLIQGGQQVAAWVRIHSDRQLIQEIVR